MENKKIKEIYELLKGQPQEKINAIIESLSVKRGSIILDWN